MMRRFWSLVVVAIGGAVGVFALVSSTYAAINEGDAIYQKALYEGVSNCYTTGSDAGGLIGEISLEAFDGSINKLVPNANGAGSKVVPVPGSDKGKLVNGLPGISCAELLSRRTDLKVSSAPVGGEAERKKTLENLQYTLVSGGDNSSKKCFTFKYAGGTTAENKTIYSAPSVCISGKDRNRAWTVADNGNGVISFSGSGSSSLTVSASRTNFWGSAGENQEVDFWGNLTETRMVDLGGKTDGEALKAVGDAIVSILDTTFDKAVFETRRQVTRPGTTGNVTEVTKYYSPCYSYKVSSNKIECDAYESGFSAGDFSGQFTSSANLFGTYKKPDVDRSSRSTTLPNILKSVSGNKFKTYGALALTDAEVYRLYLSYLQDDYGMSNFQCSDSAIDTSREYKDIRMWNASASKWMDHCNFDAKKSESLNNGSTSTQHTITVWGVYNDGERKNHFGNPVTLEQIVDWLRSANIKSDPGVTGGGTSGGSSSSGTPGGTSGSASSGSVNDTTDLCYNAGLESTEWILCPAMGNMEYAATAIDGVIQSWLEVRADTYDSSSNLYIGWEIVRNVANVVIVVVLVVIVFSQLTGYGIDNYGIKKMLPKLILMAILLNLSFIMCQLAVDLSNVLGVGLRNMFGSIGNALGANTVSGNFIGDMIAGIFTGGAVVGAAAGTITAAMIVSGPMAVIMVILALVAVLVAVLLFFIMLGARKVIVMVCIVLAPIAFVMYILPNTQGIFKKWWNLFKAALIIFPICGALGGISNMVRGLVGSGGEVWEYVVALLLPYLPFFLLPALLKGAIAGLGVIGGAITAGLGALRTGAGRAVDAGRGALQGTEAYKNAQSERARRMQERNAQRTINRLNARRRATGGLSEADTRRLARAQEAQRRLAGEDTAARTVLAQSDYADKSEAELQADWNRAFDAGNTQELDVLTNVMSSRYGASAAKFIAGSLAEKQVFSADGSGFSSSNYEKSFNALRMNMESNSALAGNMKNKASDAYQMLTSGGYIEREDGDGNKRQVRGNLAEHSAKNNVATKLSDWATQSGSTLQRAAIAGSLNAGTAQELLNSDDPSIKSGIASDPDSRRVLEAVAAGYKGTTGQDGRVRWNKEAADAAVVERAHTQALRENMEFDVRRADQSAQADAQIQRDRTQERIAENLERLSNQGGPQP